MLAKKRIKTICLEVWQKSIRISANIYIHAQMILNEYKYVSMIRKILQTSTKNYNDMQSINMQFIMPTK